jgi:transposase
VAKSDRELALEALVEQLTVKNGLLIEQISLLGEQIAAQDAKIQELERRDRRDSTNSSQPPSQDPPKTRAERRRDAREKVKREAAAQKRKAGGQPGHEGKHRQKCEPGRVDRRSVHLPTACGCGHVFDGTEEQVGDPVIHQQWELPPARPLVFQYDLLRLGCPCCGRSRLAELPAGVSWSAFAPRLEAHIATLAGVYRLSRRQTQDVIQSMFAVPISLGAVDAAIMRMSKLLEDPWQQLRDHIQAAGMVHADETSWRLAGAQQYLWLASTALAACYRIDATRSQAAAKELLGEEFGGILISDRYAGYHFLDVLQQQLCWSHVLRQLVEISQHDGAAGRLGVKLLAAGRRVIHTHHQYVQDGHDLSWLRAQLKPLRDEIEQLLEKGVRGHHQRTSNFCTGLLAEFDALWTFCDVQDMQIPVTNNAAERALRHAVILRRVQGGTQSEHGSRWIERILSVRETLRLQDRPVLDYLVEAAVAGRYGLGLPSVLPAGP